MANQLKVAVVHAIEVLLARGWSQRRIAATLQVDRSTVARYASLRRAGPDGARAAGEANPATAPPGSDGPGTASAMAPGAIGGASPISKPATGTEAPPGSAEAPPGSTPAPAQPRPDNQTSRCEPFRAIIQAKLDQGLTARRIHQDLVCEHGFQPEYHSVRRFVRRLSQGRPLPFRRMECARGEEAQVDFGQGAPIQLPNGRRRRPHVFRIVLSHSRKGYSEAVLTQSTEAFISALENAFRHFGGAPRTLVVDNLKAAVLKADWFDPELNPKIQSFCEHYNTVILPTKPRTPRHKGKIESGVKYVQSNGLKGRSFASLTAQNEHLREWEASVADTRIHGTTRRQVSQVFQEVERAALLPLPVDRFPFFHEAQRSVHRDGHVEVDKAYYSVAPEYLGCRVWVRWDSRTVRIFDRRMKQITYHAKRQPGEFATEPAHLASEKINSVERGAAWLLNKVAYLGPHTRQWAEAMLAERGVQGVRVLQGLRSLARRHPSTSIDQACAIADSHGAYRLRFIRTLIKRAAPKQQQFEFMDTHPIIRSLSDYDKLVHTSVQRTVHQSEPFIQEHSS